MKKDWYSAMLRYVCLVEGGGADLIMDSVFIFLSTSFEEALTASLAIGRSKERTYLNEEKKRVRWALKEVLTLDKIVHDSLDGVEVYSSLHRNMPPLSLRFNTKFHPEVSKPIQTI